MSQQYLLKLEDLDNKHLYDIIKADNSFMFRIPDREEFSGLELALQQTTEELGRHFRLHNDNLWVHGDLVPAGIEFSTLEQFGDYYLLEDVYNAKEAKDTGRINLKQDDVMIQMPIPEQDKVRIGKIRKPAYIKGLQERAEDAVRSEFVHYVAKKERDRLNGYSLAYLKTFLNKNFGISRDDVTKENRYDTVNRILSQDTGSGQSNAEEYIRALMENTPKRLLDYYSKFTVALDASVSAELGHRLDTEYKAIIESGISPERSDTDRLRFTALKNALEMDYFVDEVSHTVLAMEDFESRFGGSVDNYMSLLESADIPSRDIVRNVKAKKLVTDEGKDVVEDVFNRLEGSRQYRHRTITLEVDGQTVTEKGVKYSFGIAQGERTNFGRRLVDYFVTEVANSLSFSYNGGEEGFDAATPMDRAKILSNATYLAHVATEKVLGEYNGVKSKLAGRVIVSLEHELTVKIQDQSPVQRLKDQILRLKKRKAAADSGEVLLVRDAESFSYNEVFGGV